MTMLSFQMLEPWPIHTLVFDLDDTLFAEADYVKSGFRAVGEWALANLSLPGFEIAATRLFETGLRGSIFNQALRELDRFDDPGVVSKMLDIYRLHEPTINLLPEANEILRWSKSFFSLGLITDGFFEVQTRKVQALRLEKVIPHLVLTDKLGREHWKPSPRPYREIMEASPGDPTGYLYVGDNPRKDFLAPHDLGWRTVRIRRTGAEHWNYEPTDREMAQADISNLLELKNLLIPWTFA